MLTQGQVRAMKHLRDTGDPWLGSDKPRWNTGAGAHEHGNKGPVRRMWKKLAEKGLCYEHAPDQWVLTEAAHAALHDYATRPARRYRERE
jgi:hypothetical protein